MTKEEDLLNAIKRQDQKAVKTALEKLLKTTVPFEVDIALDTLTFEQLSGLYNELVNGNN